MANIFLGCLIEELPPLLYMLRYSARILANVSKYRKANAQGHAVGRVRECGRSSRLVGGDLCWLKLSEVLLVIFTSNLLAIIDSS
jgi:hypothetical protein